MSNFSCFSQIFFIAFHSLWLGGFRTQPTFALVRVVRGDLSWDINCPIPPAHCMLGLLAVVRRMSLDSWALGCPGSVINCSKGG